MRLELTAAEMSVTPSVAEVLEMSPLTLMLHAMRHYARVGRWDTAAHIANMAAPYCHQTFAPIAPAADEEQGCPCN
jgi:hypothetical protein